MKFVKTGWLCAVTVAGATALASNEYTTSQDGTVLDVTLTANDAIITDKLSADGVDTLRFTRGGGCYSVKLRSSGGNDLPGGVIADGYLLKIQNPNVLGSGPVVLTNQYSGLYGDSWSSLPAIDVSNRVVFDMVSSYAAGEGSKNLVLHNIGVTGGNADKVVTLGRDGGAQATVTLSLDGEGNDPIGYFNLRGALALTLDGGTIRAAGTGNRALFQAASAATPATTVLNKPLTIDVADGGDISLGVSPSTWSKVHTATNAVEELKPDNWSFESGNTGWTFGTAQGGNTSGVYSNGSSFDDCGSTTNGSKYAMVRNGSTLSRTVSLPTGGLWRVVFEQGCRKGAYSKNIGTSVTLGGTTVLTIPKKTSDADLHGFKEFRSRAVQLAAGDCELAITLSYTGENGSLNFDAIRFERCEETEPAFILAKTGAGALTLTGDDFPAATADLKVSVDGGALSVVDAALAGNSFAVANGAELRFSGVSATNAAIGVTAGGTVAFGLPEENLVKNGGFETPETTTYGYQSNGSCKWTLSPSSGNGTPGLQRNGSAVTSAEADRTPYGNQSLYLRTGTTAEQSITVAAAGDYLLSFWQAPRNYASSHELALTVFVDDVKVVENAGQEARYKPFRTSKTLSLTAGSHTLKFSCAAGGGSGSMVFVDDVSLAAVPSSSDANDFSKSTLSLASGSTVKLNQPERAKVHVGTVLVDGVMVRGGRGALVAAGVNVEGTGRLRCGAPFGLSVIIK